MAQVPELSDTWSPEVPDAEELLAGAPRPEEPARAVLEVARDPRVDQLLRPNERDSYLVRDVEQLEASDAVRAADALAEMTLVPRPPSPVVGTTPRTRAFVSRP